jgi:DNA modification methylase
MTEPTLFEMPDRRVLPVEVLPVSVVEVGAQGSGRRSRGGHDATSSRSDRSHFPREVSSLCFDLYLRGRRLCLDPFAGWGERGAAARERGFGYSGFDISQESVEAARNEYGIENTLADSRTADFPEHDCLLTCPPYWNLETYGGYGLEEEGSWESFLSGYEGVLERCYKASIPGSAYCIMVGDWRHDGIYYPLAHETRRIMYGLGAETIDEVVVSRKNVTKIKVMLPQAIEHGYTVKVHESLLVFKT